LAPATVGGALHNATACCDEEKSSVSAGATPPLRGFADFTFGDSKNKID